MTWKPHLTVAAIIEQNSKFLMVEEHLQNRLYLNQPAGHLEPDEIIIDAVIRETLEETAFTFEPSHVTGIYQWCNPENNTTFIRFSFCGTALKHDPERTLDKEIVQAIWLTLDEIKARHNEHRSPMVLASIEDYLAGQRYSLDVLKSAG